MIPRVSALAVLALLGCSSAVEPPPPDDASSDVASSDVAPFDAPSPEDVATDDTALPPEDTALPPEDTALPPEDTALPPVDTGVAPVDTGAPPVDTGMPPPPPPPPAVPTCIGTAASGDAGGTCSGLPNAFTARGINAGYYPFRVLRPVTQYSGDFDGDPSMVFRPGARARGVVLQTVTPGAYVALSTVAQNYNPPTGCDTDTCGNPSRAACRENSPPLRAPVAGFYWGYAYQGASHMQCGFALPPGSVEFAGYDPRHSCALGPAGADWEVHAVCGRATACAGSNPTCGAVNHCDEGGDDCARTACGAMAGGPLTPSAWRRTVTTPSGTHACTRTPPHPSVRCLENGRERDFFFVYPFGAYLYWAQNSTTRAWIHDGDRVQVYFHNRDRQGVLWDFVEVLSSGAPVLTPASDGAGASGGCSSTSPGACRPCRNGGTCGWVQDVFLR